MKDYIFMKIYANPKIIKIEIRDAEKRIDYLPLQCSRISIGNSQEIRGFQKTTTHPLVHRFDETDHMAQDSF